MSCPRLSSSPEQGFTLVELVVVAVLLAIMSGILYGTISGILRGRALIGSEQDTARVAQYVLERMSRELTCRAPVPLSQQTSDSQQTSSQTYTSDTLEGINGEGANSDQDSIRFVSLNSGQVFFSSLPNYGLVEIEYRLEEAQRSSGGRGSNNNQGMLLIREEVPADVRTTEIIKKRRVAFPIAEKVSGLNFRYRREGKWLNEWKGQGSRLPEAVEITLSLGAEQGKAETYRTAVFLTQMPKQSG